MKTRSLLALLTLSTCTSASALTSATGTLDVTASVRATCSISSAELKFGELTLGTVASSLLKTAKVTVSCNAVTPYTFTLAPGKYNQGTIYRMRQVADPSVFIPYELTAVTAGTYTALTNEITVTGSVVNSGALAVGDYEDQVLMTFSY